MEHMEVWRARKKRKYIIFPRANNGRSREKKISGEAICSRYQRALSGF